MPVKPPFQLRPLTTSSLRCESQRPFQRHQVVNAEQSAKKGNSPLWAFLRAVMPFQRRVPWV